MPPAYLGYFVLALGVLAPATALAQNARPPAATTEQQDQARARAQEGLKLYNAGRAQEAYASFHEADALFHVPSITIYLARCQVKLGKLLDARETYERILAEDLARDAPPAFVAAHLDAGKELSALKPRVPSLRVLVTGVASGTALVTLDGAPLTDEKKDLDPGSHTVEARVGRALPMSKTIVLDEGNHETITMDLGALAAAPEAAPAAVNRVPAFVAFGVGGAGAVVGGVLGGLALAQASDIKARCGGAPPCSPKPPDTRADLESQAAAAKAKAWGANVGLGFAVVGVATGIVLFALKLPKTQQAQSVVGPGGLTLRF